MPVRPSKGFSLLEILMALGLALLLIGLGAVHLWPARTSASSRALADSLAEELRLAGRSAVASGVPVAVALATGNSGPHGQAYYHLAGQARPQLVRVRNLAREFPDTFLCVGTWARSDVGAWTRTQPKPMSNSDTFDPSGWVNPVNPQDPTLIFTPSGSVTSNGLPLWNGDFYLVASQGVEFQPQAVSGSGPSLTYYRLRRLAKPWCIRVSAAGAVAVTSGLPAADSSTALEQRGFTTAAAPSPPLMSIPGNSAPAIVACTVTPEPPDGAAAGTAVLAPGEHLALRVTASDPQGDPVYCRWSANGGDFSSPDKDAMEWQNNQWVSQWEWRPPAGAVSGNFQLTCTLTDSKGASTSGGAQGSLAVRIEDGPSIVFGDSSEDLVTGRLRKIHLSGSGEVDLAPLPQGFSGLDVAANGDRLLYNFGGLLYACNQDGTLAKVVNFDIPGNSVALHLPWIFFGGVDYSPQGTRLVFPGLGVLPVEPPSVDLYLAEVQGGTVVRFTSNNSRNEEHPFWSCDDRFIVYNSVDPADSSDVEIRLKPLAGGPSVLLTGGLSGGQELIDLCPSLVAGNHRLLYRESGNLKVMDFTADGAVVDPLVGNVGPANFRSGRFSQDGARVTFHSGVDVFVCDADGSDRLQLTDSAGSGRYYEYPRFTPDGSQVVYTGLDISASSFTGDLFRSRIDGSSSARITRGNKIAHGLLPYSGWDIVP